MSTVTYNSIETLIGPKTTAKRSLRYKKRAVTDHADGLSDSKFR